MKPVFQTKFGVPEGNCHAAAVAGILELPLEAIPDFGIDDEWFIRFSRWCRSSHAFEPLMFEAEGDGKPSGFHLMSGKSPRYDCKHCVVGFMGDMVHDPHPSGDGLLTVDTYTVFALLDPRIVSASPSSPRKLESIVIQQLVDALGQYHSAADCKAEGRVVNCTACQALRMVRSL